MQEVAVRSIYVMSALGTFEDSSRNNGKICSVRLSELALILLAFVGCPRPQANFSPSKTLPSGVLEKLAADEREYCEDQFGERFRKGCDEKFAANLKWSEVTITPAGETAVLIENQNRGFCGSAGCALYLFARKGNADYVQILGNKGDVGTLKRLTVSKQITSEHYNVEVTWSDGKTRSIYRWDGSRYVTAG